MADPQTPLTASVEALDVFTGLLSEVDAAGPSDGFYSRIAEATCELAAMRRAVIFVYDDDRREVRAVGAHGIDLSLFAELSPNPDTVSIARQALVEDRVVGVTGHVESNLPDEFLPLLEQGTLTCTPMSAGGRWFGVILADRAPDDGPVTDAQRHTLWSLGKVSALAAGARHATRQHELARRLAERIDLARDIHEAVVQRLFGVSLALSGEGELSAEVRERCRAELHAALGELRAALQRPLARSARATRTTLRAEIDRLRRQHRDIDVRLVEGDPDTVPAELEALAQSVLREAVRNAAKHAEPSSIDIALGRPDGTFVLEVLNDGVAGRRPRPASGMGLRLAAFEALAQGGVVEFGPAGKGRWRVRLAVPLGAAT